MKNNQTNNYLKLFFLSLWILFTSAMVIWWWIHALSDNNSSLDNALLILKHERMLMWEGFAFLAAILIAGFYLWKFINDDIVRHNQLKVFFSNFSHDIKTSITRLRLQSEVIQDQKNYAGDEKLKQLIRDILRLDLQLENSLYIAQENDYQIFSEKVLLSYLIQNIKSDFPEIEIYLEKDVVIEVDKRLFICVLRNLINNSVVHGAATEIRFNVNILPAKVELTIKDNGNSSESSSKGHGLGLNLCTQLINKMNGEFKVLQSQPQFSVEIKIPGSSL